MHYFIRLGIDKMDREKKRIIKKGDVVILLLTVLLAGAAFLFSICQVEGDYVHVTVNGNVTTYVLAENRRLVLKHDGTAYNTVVIQHGEVFMEEASCPDQICVHHKAISKNGESIICLPNEVYVEVESGKENIIDN